jgi:hypothetical protein
MTIEQFAAIHRLRITRDECLDKIIQGKRGHLYFDEQDLCLMVLDGSRVLRSRWLELGGTLWLGEVSDGLQDVKITGIPLEKATLAMKLARVFPRRSSQNAVRVQAFRFKSNKPAGNAIPGA